MPETIGDADALATALSGRIIALAGPPAAGKSTLADHLADALGAVVLPMDGFHYDDAVLAPRGLLPRKGAPETFDIAGFSATLARVAGGEETAVPVFDRARELSRAAARIVPAAARVIVEGNYLLLNRPGWADLAAHFDQTVMIDVPLATLRARLAARWDGMTDATSRIEANDLPNAKTVIGESRPADIIYQPR